MDRIKSILIFILGGVGTLVLAIQLFVWISPLSRAQEGEPSFELPPAGEGSLPPPPVPTEPVAPPPPPPTSVGANENEFAVPTPTVPPAQETANLTETEPGQAGDFLAPYIFDTREGRRNPFRPVILKDDSTDRAAIGPATPLERFDVDELKLIAIMWDVRNPRAMVMDPNKEIHIITKDDRIGRRQGYVATIREGELVVVETADFNGEIVYNTRIMRIEK